MTAPHGAMSLQGTVSRYDRASRTGAVLLDDGRELGFGGGAVERDVLLLRVGQRVRMQTVDGAVTRLTLLTLPWVD